MKSLVICLALLASVVGYAQQASQNVVRDIQLRNTAPDDILARLENVAGVAVKFDRKTHTVTVAGHQSMVDKVIGDLQRADQAPTLVQFQVRVVRQGIPVT